MTSAWDRKLALRATAIAIVAAGVALLVIAATDQGAPWRSRFGLWSALAPLAGSIGAAITARVAASRGELAALGALGASPGRVLRGAILGGAVVAMIGAVALTSSRVDLDAVFPAPAPSLSFTFDDRGAHEAKLGVVVAPDGELACDDAPPAHEAPRDPRRGMTALAVALFALAGPRWSATTMALRARLVFGGAAALAALASFQAVAVDRGPPAALVAAPLLLLLHALLIG